VAVTGDIVDNAQHNELANALAVLDGGTARPDSGAPGYDGVALPDWPEGLIEKALEPFESPGLRVPWLRCWGNHEQLCQGVGVVTPELARAMAGTRKPIDLPPDLDRDRALEMFTREPELFMSGPAREVAADPERRPIARRDLMPAAHYTHDTARVRFIVLDTVCDAGGARGTIGDDQLRWLEATLAEVRDRLVVVLSHHGHDSLNGDGLLGVLERFSNVVLWLNGHTHINRITRRGNLWEVTTGSIVDWPCQARLVELLESEEGALSIRCTMLDHDGGGLAGLHRDLAARSPLAAVTGGEPGHGDIAFSLPGPF
jgi:hypothetical protein